MRREFSILAQKQAVESKTCIIPLNDAQNVRFDLYTHFGCSNVFRVELHICANIGRKIFILVKKHSLSYDNLLRLKTAHVSRFCIKATVLAAARSKSQNCTCEPNETESVVLRLKTHF